jgi:REP element-mobilizing transposase RayT
MPVYLFTYHAYGTWLPNKPKGYVRRKEGVLPANSDKSDTYRRQMKYPIVKFDESMQRLLIETTHSTASFLDVEFRLIATDPTHLHVLVQCQHERGWEAIRASIKTKLSLVLKEQLGDRPWLSEGITQAGQR